VVREKVEAVQQLVAEGYTVQAACTALAVPRSSYYAAQQPPRASSEPADGTDAEWLAKIQAIKSDHPFWGYRRVWAWLRHREKLLVNQKKVRRIMKAHGLMATQTAHKAKRTPPKSKPQASRPRQLWGIDMTKFMIAALGWVYLVIVIDWYTKKIVGHYARLQAKSAHWLLALEQAVQRQFPAGVQGQKLSLMSDNGCQPTSVAFMKACATLGITQAFTSYNNPEREHSVPVAETIAPQILSLPMFPEIGDAQLDRVANVCRSNG